MLAWIRRNGLLAAGIVLALCAVGVWSADQQDVSRQEYVAPTPRPVVTESPSSSPTPSSTRAPQPSASPTPSISDPVAADKPQSVVVKRAGEPVFPAAAIGRATSFSKQGVWSPKPGTIEWYQADGHQKPGTLSDLRAVIAGHVKYDGKDDVFADLRKVKRGDIITVTYASGKTYDFMVRKIIVEDKDALRTNQDIWGYQKKQSRSLVLFTCDDRSGFNSAGHRRDNRAIIAY